MTTGIHTSPFYLSSNPMKTRVNGHKSARALSTSGTAFRSWKHVEKEKRTTGPWRVVCWVHNEEPVRESPWPWRSPQPWGLAAVDTEKLEWIQRRRAESLLRQLDGATLSPCASGPLEIPHVQEPSSLFSHVLQYRVSRPETSGGVQPGPTLKARWLENIGAWTPVFWGPCPRTPTGWAGRSASLLWGMWQAPEESIKILILEFCQITNLKIKELFLRLICFSFLFLTFPSLTHLGFIWVYRHVFILLSCSRGILW